MENDSGWKSNKKSRMNIIVGSDENPTQFKGGEVIINKKATKKNIKRLVEINDDGSGKTTTDASDGGLLKGPSHDQGGIPGVVGGTREIETEGEEFVVAKEASEKHWQELSKINQSTGGVPINKPGGFDDDPEEYKEGGKIDFNPNKLPNKNILKYAEKIRTEYPEIWKLGGNIFGNQAYKNLKRVSERGYWKDSEEWMFIKWRSYVARHQRDFRIEGVVAMLKWVDTVEKGWPYMKQLIEEKIKKVESKKKGWRHKTNMKEGGRTIAQTPAPKKERIKGSNINKPGSSATTKSASSIKFDEKTIESINNKVKEHNQKHPNKKITLASAKAVVRRGMGAYSSSHRPTITGGKPNSRTAWGFARLNAFTYKIVHGKSKSGKYSQDDDLINELGYSVAKYHLGGDMSKHLAPNGEPSNLTHEQWHLVRTPEFKKWFGDWENDSENASKVVDENGEPLVVYHGTASNFSIFKVGRTGGIFFTNNKSSAERFSSGDLKRQGDNPRILKCFLNVRKHYDKQTNDENVIDTYYTQFFTDRPFISKSSQKNILKDKYKKFFMDLVSFGIVNQEPKEKIVSYNYDGIVIDSDNNSKSYIVFEPNQIKLADGSNTTFDGNNPM